jgi:hypothetical protein
VSKSTAISLGIHTTGSHMPCVHSAISKLKKTKIPNNISDAMEGERIALDIFCPNFTSFITAKLSIEIKQSNSAGQSKH